MNPPRVALIISTYNQHEYLARVLSAVAGQSVHPDEVLVADDGSGETTGKVFDRWQAAQPYRCEHLWQEHSGVRRARILNAAIVQVAADYCVFLEGDTVPHPRFVEDHRSLALTGHFVDGRRATIGKVATRFFGREAFRRDRSRALIAFQVGGVSGAFRWPASRPRVREDLNGLNGGSLGVWRTDLESANGYDEALAGTDAVEAELAARLLNRGVKRLAVSGRAICYQLWQATSGGAASGRAATAFDRAIREKRTRCEAGLDAHKLPPTD
jgi:glycosyltransferase involved in cell wall biosynthesis